MNRGAIIDDTQRYRYALWREWDDKLPPVLWVMLNPSTADADIDDPTIRRCIGLSTQFGYGSLTVVNLFAWRATKPEELLTAEDAVGPLNDIHIRQLAIPHLDVICAWGSNVPKRYSNRPAEVLSLLRDTNTCALRLSKHGQPWHPLYLPSSVIPMPWRGENHTRA